jgi:AcrR family transcriptional regulator
MTEQQERILSKAHELFMKFGIRSVSMDEIATNLGMSKKTIYQFYEDKDALVEGVIEMEMDENEGSCCNNQEASKDAIHEIFLSLEEMSEILQVMNPLLMNDLQKYHPKAFKKIQDFKNKFLYDLLEKNLQSGVADGLYRPEINIAILSKYRIATVFLLFNSEIFPESKFNLLEVMYEMTDNFLYGIATAKGQKLIQKYKQQSFKSKSL